MNKLFQSSLLTAITLITLSSHKAVQAKQSLQDSNSFNPPVCQRIGDRNRGHGNDPYIEFAMNISEIGAVQISGDFDLDNPGVSMDKQMDIISGHEKIYWSNLSSLQKQKIKDEWARQLCPLKIIPD